MKIGILETGLVPEDLRAKHGAYVQMFEAALGAADLSISFVRYAVHEGQLPAMPQACAAYVITGSAAGVYDDLPWIAPLERFIRKAADAKVPQAGICFGHQAMAQAFGGTVRKSVKGWGCGLHTYEVLARRSWMTPGLERLSIPSMHQDQVVELPERAMVVAGSNFCPYGVLEYRDVPAISFQQHPEFSPEYARDLTQARRGSRIPPVVADVALRSLAFESDRAAVARWIVSFLKGAQRG